MEQTRVSSFIEACINTTIGFVISYFAWPVAAALFDIPYSHGQHFGVVLFFTVLSVVRGYIVRRWFNSRLHKLALSISDKITP